MGQWESVDWIIHLTEWNKSCNTVAPQSYSACCNRNIFLNVITEMSGWIDSESQVAFNDLPDRYSVVVFFLKELVGLPCSTAKVLRLLFPDRQERQRSSALFSLSISQISRLWTECGNLVWSIAAKTLHFNDFVSLEQHGNNSVRVTAAWSISVLGGFIGSSLWLGSAL